MNLSQTQGKHTIANRAKAKKNGSGPDSDTSHVETCLSIGEALVLSCIQKASEKRCISAADQPSLGVMPLLLSHPFESHRGRSLTVLLRLRSQRHE